MSLKTIPLAHSLFYSSHWNSSIIVLNNWFNLLYLRCKVLMTPYFHGTKPKFFLMMHWLYIFDAIFDNQPLSTLHLTLCVSFRHNRFTYPNSGSWWESYRKLKKCLGSVSEIFILKVLYEFCWAWRQKSFHMWS